MVNTAFVASTLPAAFLLRNAERLGISKIVVATNFHYESYRYLSQRVPSIKVEIAPKSKPRLALYLALKLLKAKFFKGEIFFFHECCWPELDLLIFLIRPKGVFYPRATLNSFVRLNEEQISKICAERRIVFFKRILIRKFFFIYRQRTDGGKGYLYVPVFKTYPPSIQMFPVGYNEGEKKDAGSNNKKHNVSRREILFIVARDTALDDDLRDKFAELIKIAQHLGYRVSIKDHPNASSRLNLAAPDCTIIDPALPAEFLDDEYSFVAGVASAGLIRFGQRAISFIDMIATMSDDDRSLRKGYLLSLSSELTFIKNEDEFAKILS